MTTPALELAQSVRLARQANDLAAATTASYSIRFQVFATLPMPSPEQVAPALARNVTEPGLALTGPERLLFSTDYPISIGGGPGPFVPGRSDTLSSVKRAVCARQLERLTQLANPSCGVWARQKKVCSARTG